MSININVINYVLRKENHNTMDLTDVDLKQYIDQFMKEYFPLTNHKMMKSLLMIS